MGSAPHHCYTTRVPPLRRPLRRLASHLHQPGRRACGLHGQRLPGPPRTPHGVSLLMYPATELEATRPTSGCGATVLYKGGGHAALRPWQPQQRGAGRGLPGGQRLLGVGLECSATFALTDDGPRWSWTVEVERLYGTDATVDVVHTFDPAPLAPYGAVRTNEFYVSQYLDISPIDTDRHGTALAVRQNMPGPRRCRGWCHQCAALGRPGPRTAQLVGCGRARAGHGAGAARPSLAAAPARALACSSRRTPP